jgi:hypothetical protein
MSRVLQPTNPTQFPVSPGTQVVTQLTMATAVDAGDYVYNTLAGYGVATTSTGIYYNQIPVSGQFATGFVQTANLNTLQYGPVFTQGTYTGTTYALGATVTAATSLNSVSNASFPGAMCALTSGNFVYVYRTAANSYSFTILSPTGASIAAATAIGTDISSSYNAQVITATPLIAGGFIIAYFGSTGTNAIIKKYTATGTLSSSGTIALGGNSASCGLINFIELSNGNFALIFSNASSSGSYVVVDSALTVVKSVSFIDSSATNYGNIDPTTHYLNACALYGGGFVMSWYSGTAGQHLINTASNTGTLTLSSAYTASGPLNSTTSYRTPSICPTSDGNFAIAYHGSSTNTLNYVRVYRSGGSFTYNTSGTLSTGISSTNITYRACIFPIQNDLLGIFYMNSSNHPSVTLASASTLSSTTWGSAILLNGTTTSSMFVFPNLNFCATNGKASFIYAGTSSFPTFTTISTIAITNGTTYAGLTFSPQSYYLMGVSLNSASSGQLANVVINGSATLNSNYPSLTSTVPFDFSGSGPFGNSGTVSGRTVLMKGLE